MNFFQPPKYAVSDVPRSWQSKLLDGRPCSATWQRPVVWQHASWARHPSLSSCGDRSLHCHFVIEQRWSREYHHGTIGSHLSVHWCVTRFKYGISTMTAWPAIIYKWVSCNSLLPPLSHPAIYVGDFNCHHPDWGYDAGNTEGEQLIEWASCNDAVLIHDAKQRGKFISARWQRHYSPDLCWVSTVGGHPLPASCVDPHSQHGPSIIHIGLTVPFIRTTNKKRWNFRKANWDEFTAAAEKSIPLIPRHDIPVEEAYSRFNCALLKAAQTAVPRGCHAIYIPCMDEEAKALLEEYETSGVLDIADQLIESLDAARWARWEESTAHMNFTHSSRKSWSLLRQLGASQRLPRSTRPTGLGERSRLAHCPSGQGDSRQEVWEESSWPLASRSSELHGCQSRANLSSRSILCAEVREVGHSPRVRQYPSRVPEASGSSRHHVAIHILLQSHHGTAHS